MSEHIHVMQVGAPDHEDLEVLRQEVPGEPVCVFNNTRYPAGERVCSGDALLRCDYGIWVREGTCDPDNP